MPTAVVPEHLVVMPPGPALSAALSALPLSSVPNDRMLEVLRAQHRQLCHEQARMMAVIAEVGRCEGYPEPGEIARLDAPQRYASEETRAALRWTRRSAECEHDLAEAVVRGMPVLHTAWLAGEVDRPRVRVFDRYLVGLTPEQIERICRIAVPQASRLTTGQLAVLLRRMVIAVDPDAAARWYRKGIRERDVAAHMDHDGTVRVSANGLPADEAEAACVRLQDLAGAAKRAGHPGSIGQIRCDLFLGMLDGRFHHMTAEQVIACLIAGYRPAGPAAEETVGAAQADPTDLATAQATDQHSARSVADDPPGGRTEEGIAGGGAAGAPARDASARAGSAPGRVVAPGRVGAPARDASARAGSAPGRVVAPGRVGAPAAVRDERVGIEIRVGLGTLLGLDEHPGEIPGLGLIPAPDARHRVLRQRRAEWRFAVTDAEGHLVLDGFTRRRPQGAPADGPPGGIVELHVPAALLDELAAMGPVGTGEWAGIVADVARRYAGRHTHHADLDARPGDRLPGAALRRHTEIRDRTCTFVGCRHRARTCEQDHSHDHDRGGATVRVNLGPACPHDHAVKHEGGWTVEQPEPGTFVWRSPLGGEYPTRGEFLLPPMPDPSPVDLGPGFDQPTRTDDGPILRRPPPDPPRERPPPRPRGVPEEPPF